MNLWDNVLVNPPFRNDPPLKLNVQARVMGIIALVLGILGALGMLILLPAVVFVSSTVNSLCNDPLYRPYYDCSTHTYALATVGVIIGVVGVVAQIVGGIWMMNGNVKGRALLVYALILGFLGNLLVAIGYGGSGYFGVVVDIVVYYFIVIARFPGEAPLVATPTIPGGYPPQQYPPQQGYQQPPQAYPPQAPPAQAPPQAPPQYPPQQPPAPPAPPV